MQAGGPLARFLRAQERAHGGIAEALSELRAARKQGHWIWYVFPQLVGLGSSPAAVEYGLHGVEEAREYLADPTLRERLLAATSAVAEQLGRGVRLRELMGSEIDALKLVSSLTLFEAAMARASDSKWDDVGQLEKLTTDFLAEAEKQGFSRCSLAQNRLERGSNQKIRATR
jgi:uncharacterized protein (DUF1810 family)